MKIIVGLGNPGTQYANTRHNAGFVALDSLARKLDTSFDKTNFNGLYAEGRLEGEKIILLKPQTYMNLSGQSVSQLVNFYKIEIEDLLVIYDDMDLNAGELRLRKSGRAGGHNGMQNIIDQLGTDKINRIKMGIGHPLVGSGANFVLQPLVGDNLKEFLDLGNMASNAALCWVKEGIVNAMNQFNTSKAKKEKVEKRENKEVQE